MRRRTGSAELARRVARDLQSLNSLVFVELDADRAEQATDLAADLGLRGMDAVVVQAAKEFRTALVSLDEEIIGKARHAVTVRDVASFD